MNSKIIQIDLHGTNLVKKLWFPVKPDKKPFPAKT